MNHDGEMDASAVQPKPDPRADTIAPAWVLIPARGGSVSVPRKNVRLVAGQPLISYVITTALQVVDSRHVIVITDDRQIEDVSRATGASVIFETQSTPSEETLDEKILRNLPILISMGATDADVIVTVQPTSPLLTQETLLKAISIVGTGQAHTAMTVTDDRHLSWTQDEDGHAKALYKARVNRQYLPLEFRETGGAIASRLGDALSSGTRVVPPVALVPVSAQEAIDIDHFGDLYVAAHFLTRRRIVIRVDAGPSLGMGHVYRALALATELARHEILVVTRADHELGAEFFSRFPYNVHEVADDEEFFDVLSDFAPDLTVLDILDTTSAFIERIRASAPATKVVSFEDTGEGAQHVDLLVAEFIDNHEVPESRQLRGIEYSLLSPHFETVSADHAPADKVGHILVLFGGTDPSDLAKRSLEALAQLRFAGAVTVVRGLGASPLEAPQDLPYSLEILNDVRYMPSVMQRADIALTSAGRTIIELASLGIPSVCIAQNEREMTHTHACEENGVYMLGLGSALRDDEIREGIRLMLNGDVRLQLANLARLSGSRRSNRRTVETILDRVGLNVFPNL